VRRVVLAVGLAGCLFPSLSDLSSDGGVDASDASDVVTTDVATSDAVADVVDGALLAFCASQADAAFCDDFDDTSQPFFAKWSTSIDDGGKLERLDAGLSLPSALGVTIAAADGGQPGAYLWKNFTGVSRFTLLFDCIIDTYDTGGSTLILNQVETNGYAFSVRMPINATGARVSAAIYPPDASASFVDLAGPFVFDPNVWHNVRMDVDLAAVPANATVVIDGTTRVADAGVPGATFGPGAVQLTAGAFYANAPTSGWRFRVDNVAFFH